jgi:hypothetical protein
LQAIHSAADGYFIWIRGKGVGHPFFGDIMPAHAQALRLNGLMNLRPDQRQSAEAGVAFKASGARRGYGELGDGQSDRDG